MLKVLESSNKKSVVHKAVPHDSASLHVSGRATYTDDILEKQGTLHAFIFQSPHAKAKLTKLDLQKTKQQAGVHAVLTSKNIPGINQIGAIFQDEPLLAENNLEYAGQPIFVVAAESVQQAREAANLAVVEYEVQTPILTIEEALEQKSFVAPSYSLKTGDAEQALKNAPQKFNQRYKVGGQDHFYLEGQVAVAMTEENGAVQVFSSTQHPSEVQHMVAKVLGIAEHLVIVETRRLGGGFGGKETQAAIFACIAAVLAQQTQRPVKLRLDRDDDMTITGKRHAFLADCQIGFDDQGKILAYKAEMAADCGYAADLSTAVVDRALFHADNAYFLPQAEVIGQRCKTNLASNTAFRGFGGPQGMFFIEQCVDDIARILGKDALEIRQLNYYTEEFNTTHYGQELANIPLAKMTQQLVESSDYWARRKAVESFNQQHKSWRKGLALTPVKFGISFTVQAFNQAGALIQIYQDGSVQLNHGGVEMGQGLFIKVAQVVAEILGIPLRQIRPMATDTSKVPNTSATAASSGADLNCKAAEQAAFKLKQRLAQAFTKQFNTDAKAVQFKDQTVQTANHSISFVKVVQLAYQQRLSLSATGFYKTPHLHFDRQTGKGNPFYYFAYGLAASEVLVDCYTGESQILRADILQDCGSSLNPAIDIGQIEGAFVQGAGWLTSEELVWDTRGKLQTHAPSTYKIPSFADQPIDFRVALYNQPNHRPSIYRSKAVGEPPLMLCFAPFLAIKDAVGSFNQKKQCPHLDAPATPERVVWAIEQSLKRT